MKILMCLILVVGLSKGDPTGDEPVCSSRYDYEHNVLRSIVTMEIEQEKLHRRIDNLRKGFEDEQEHHKDMILRMEETIKQKEADINSLVSRVSELSKNRTVYMEKYEQEKNFIYKDILAQATCRALVSGGNEVNAVRRACTSTAADCYTVCSRIELVCFNSLHVYDAKAMTADVGQIGLQMYRYDSCGGSYCGPNYCCCRS